MTTQNEQTIALIDLNEDLENYFSNTIIPQLFVDAQLILRKFTPPAMKHFKLEAEFIGMPFEKIRDNFRFPTIMENIKTVIDTGEILEKEIQTTDMRWYQMNILPYLVRKENKTNGVIITFVDITPRINDLKEQEKLITEHELLLDTIAHDLKNPIFALGLTIHVLKKMPEKGMENFPALLQNIENSLLEMKKVVGDLVDTRWQKDKYQAKPELLDLHNIIEDVKLALAPQILERDAVIKQQIHSSEVTFIRRKLRSVIYNLINNAIKYTPSDRSPEIVIKSFRENGYIVISVADNGIGIPKAAQQSIFEKFNRINLQAEGSGVGLYLVNTIVALAGGKVTVDSEPGKGAVFNVYLKSDDHHLRQLTQ
ncbi:histidine kinase [Pedobacter sp. PACM 27299]|uniref:sensor histidine kinase n=1 Tax=Pedobacter sp. PACM 27299 TaxID=1727164 RepID=UPI000706859E|nr:ATP-binding protein [Pedobacter sp. PACM 27299]ALL06909.1 histidine kinase [Pedobacter sp. PACM 27299]